MVKALRRFLQSLNQVPEGKYPSFVYTPLWRRGYVWANYCYLLAGLAHGLFLLVFMSLGVYGLALFNILSVSIWTASFVLHRKGVFWVAYNMAASEVIAHAVLCVLVIGWGAGFQYYVIMPAILLFCSPWSSTMRTIWAVLFSATYGVMYFYGSTTPPAMALDPIYLQLFYQGNIITLCGLGALVAYLYHNIIIKMENKLETAYQNSNIALAERNQILKRLQEELSEAAEYVKKILPEPIVEGSIRTNWRFIPSASLGGDAFGYHRVDRDHFAIYLIDVSGHGVGAALLSVSVINMLRSQALPQTDFKNPEQVLHALNRVYPGRTNKDMFFSIWYGVYDETSRELSYASGGHPPAILCDRGADGCCRTDLLRTPNIVIGGLREATYLKRTCKIGYNSTLYIFSDGVYEVEKADGSMWCFKEFAECLERFGGNSPYALDRLCDYAADISKSKHFNDDFTMLEVAFA